MAGTELSALPTVSVVVPTVGRAILADVVARSLEQNSFEVIVVADAKPDRVREILGSCGLDVDPRVRIVDGTGEGAGLARQAGADLATGDIVLFLDDDVVPAPGLVDGHRAAHELAQNRVVVGYLPVAPELVRASVTAAIYSTDYENECRLLDEHPDLVLLALWGGNLSLRRADSERVPQVADGFQRLLLEDTEFGLRCSRAGMVGVFDRALAAVHHHDQSVERFLEVAVRQAQASAVLHAQYPGFTLLPAPADGLGRMARAVLGVARAPVIGPGARAAITQVAIRLGRGRPTPLRVRAVAFARTVVQVAAVPTRNLSS
jgi:cellulose synthase/poly-beta-1,6-N-acetylglucosamine synthase-like glycosyltransferase